MRFYDVSVPISPDLPVWPGDPAVGVERVGKMEEGSAVNVSQLRLGTHTGTHVDPPFHFVPDGLTVDQLPLEVLVGPCWVADCRGERAVTAAALERAGVPEGATRLLLLTDNSRLWDDPRHPFHRDFVDIAPDGAEWMVARGIRLVGIDYASVDHIDDPDGPTHHILLPNGVVAIENLDLRHVPPNREYDLMCLPLRIAGGDGAPARVILKG